MRLRPLSTGIAILAGLLCPFLVLAAAGGLAEQTVDNIGTSLAEVSFDNTFCSGSDGGCGFIAIALTVLERFRPIITVISGIVITILGVRMMIAQEDDALTNARTFMTGHISGLVLLYLIEPFVYAFYGYNGERFRGDVAGGAAIVETELGGLINWILTVVAAMAIFFLVLSATKAIFQATSEEGVANIRKTIITSIIGLLLLVFRYTIANNFVGNTVSPVPLLGTAVTIISYLMGFLAMVALLIVVYAGIQMILTLGNEEQGKKARSLLGRAAIGFIVIFISLSLVNFVILAG